MTWSIVARAPDTGAFGVAIATRALAVGASCPFLRSGVGAVSTQSFTNRYLGPAALDGMARGMHAADAVAAALVGDAGVGIRQLHGVDARGNAAAHTGANCIEWCGSVAGPDVSVAGNMLAGPEVIAATLDAFMAAASLPLAERLLVAMEAGETAGGDRRGRQSSALRIVSSEDFADCDLRVDDHAEPLVELRRLYDLWRRDVAPGLATRPSKADPSGLHDLDVIEAGWRARGVALRFRR